MNLSDTLGEPTFTVRRSPVTVGNYRHQVKLLAARGVVTADDVTEDRIRRFVDERLAEVQPQSVGQTLHALFAICSHLERSDRFPKDLLRRLYRLKPHVPAPRMLCAKFLTPAEVDEFCSAAPSIVALTVRVASLSGLRAGELCRLAWADVREPDRLLVVRKGKTGRRLVPIVDELLAVLTEHPAARRTRALGGLVVAMDTLTVRSLERRLERLRARVGRHVNVNLLRHTRASWWAQSGVPMVKIAKWMGHSLAVCERYYAGIAEAFDPDANRRPAA